jgi:predicted adenylyl cyclase CyaB
MARNVEIKARVRDKAALIERARALADGEPVEIDQDDTFFACPRGRLKLRQFSATRGELIFYRRPDTSGPKTSYYLLSQTAEPAQLRELLTQAWGIIGRVLKKRTLFMTGPTRIHIDEVVGLGSFVELEVVLGETSSVAQGEAIAQELMARLGITANQLLDKAYVDLLQPPPSALHEPREMS